ncbi:DUF2163 domain-containing protein [uncultured Paracoccus sp.]|uniref:DUF2163 domain-containing protein n=2 Tax=Paracoccus TaxID=265 RepID=UPI00351A3BD4
MLGFTDHDSELTFAGIRFRPDAGMIAHAVVQGAGLSVDNTEAIGALSDGAIEERDIIAGRWDGAELRQWEVDWSDPAQHRLIFRGHLGEVTRAGGAFKAELRGLSEPLNQPVGRVFHPRCSAILGDAACKVNMNRPGLFGEAAITSVEGGSFQLAGLAGFDDRWFERGRLMVISGAAVDIGGHIKNDRATPNGGREVDLWTQTAMMPAVGDRVRLYAGCDKSVATCRLKFRNFLNFRGFPHLPQEDWLMAPGKDIPRSGTFKPFGELGDNG